MRPEGGCAPFCVNCRTPRFESDNFHYCMLTCNGITVLVEGGGGGGGREERGIWMEAIGKIPRLPYT